MILHVNYIFLLYLFIYEMFVYNEQEQRYLERNEHFEQMFFTQKNT